MHVCMLSCCSCVLLFVTLWTGALQAPLSMGFSMQEYWSELPCPLPGDLPDPETEPAALKSPALADGFFTTSAIWDAKCLCFFHLTGAVLPLHFLLGSQRSPTERKDETLLKGKKKWAPKMMLFPGFGMSQT